MLQSQLRLPRLGDKGRPAQTWTESGAFVLLTREVGDVGAGCLKHLLCAPYRAATSAYVLGGLLHLLCPWHAEHPIHPLLGEPAVHGLHERRCVGDVPFPPTSGRRPGRQLWLGMAPTGFSPRGLVVGMPGGSHAEHPFAPGRCADWRTPGPLTLIARRRQHLMTTVIGPPYPLSLVRLASRPPLREPGLPGLRRRPGQGQRRQGKVLVPRKGRAGVQRTQLPSTAK
jgi:hypothetical protein